MKGSQVLTRALLRRYAIPDSSAGKADRGTVLVVGGSRRVPGGVVLAGTAALRAGAGVLQIATAQVAVPALAVTLPEASVTGLPVRRDGELTRKSTRAIDDDARSATAIVLGPGSRAPEFAEAFLAHHLRTESKATIVIDAGALAAIGALPPAAVERYGGRLVVTPQAKEMGELLRLTPEQVERDPLVAARQLAHERRCLVVLKGADTFLVEPGGEAFVNRRGGPGLGTSGSGDTLSGIIGGLAARGADPLAAALWGVHAHARAGEILARRMGPVGFLARELLAEIPRVLAS